VLRATSWDKAPPVDLKEIDILADGISAHWYYRAKAEAMRRLLDGDARSVLDVGAGSGFFSRHLLATTRATEACCVDPSYEADRDEVEAGKPLHFRQRVETSDADLVLMMDVLEHVDDDVGLAAEYVAKVKPGARFLISVPAFQFLWSGHDVFLEHRRRYTLPQIEATVARSGLEVIAGNYYFGGVFPLAASIRLAQNLRGGAVEARSQLKRHHPLVNSALSAVCALEAPLQRWNRAFGLSAFVLARKP
jgi:SAM-dependent methyltransferase